MSIFFKKLIIFLSPFALFLASCSYQYHFNNNSYSTPDDALNAQREYLDGIENELKPYDFPPMGNALIVTPSKRTCGLNGIKSTGQPTREMMDYFGKFLERDYASFSKILIKSNLFASVNHVIDDFPAQYVENVKKNYSAVIYLNMESPNQISWFMLVPPVESPKRLNFDQKAEMGVPRTQSWLNSIKKQL